jgi:hypothetical protein
VKSRGFRKVGNGVQALAGARIAERLIQQILRADFCVAIAWSEAV